MTLEALVPIVWLMGFYFFVAVEMFLPTAGMAGVLAAVMIVVAIFKAWTIHPTYAVTLMGFWILTTPPLLWTLVRIWPRTPIGRRVLNRRDDDPPTHRPPPSTRGGRPLLELIECQGVAVTDLLPSGYARVEGEKVAAVSDAGSIDSGSTIRVVGVRDRSLVVLPCRAEIHEPTSIPGEGFSPTSPLSSPPPSPGFGSHLPIPDDSVSEGSVNRSPAALEIDLDDVADDLDPDRRTS